MDDIQGFQGFSGKLAHLKHNAKLQEAAMIRLPPFML